MAAKKKASSRRKASSKKMSASARAKINKQLRAAQELVKRLKSLKKAQRAGRYKRKYREGSFMLIGGEAHQRAMIKRQNRLEAEARAIKAAEAAKRAAERAALEAGLTGPRLVTLNDPRRRRGKRRKLSASAKRKMASGARRYRRFMKQKRAQGYSVASARAAWRKQAKTEKAKSKPRRKKSSRDASSNRTRGLKRYQRFMRSQKKTWNTRAQARALWKAGKGKRRRRDWW
jgi:hypothetical protein